MTTVGVHAISRLPWVDTGHGIRDADGLGVTTHGNGVTIESDRAFVVAACNAFHALHAAARATELYDRENAVGTRDNMEDLYWDMVRKSVAALTLVATTGLLDDSPGKESTSSDVA